MRTHAHTAHAHARARTRHTQRKKLLLHCGCNMCDVLFVLSAWRLRVQYVKTTQSTALPPSWGQRGVGRPQLRSGFPVLIRDSHANTTHSNRGRPAGETPESRAGRTESRSALRDTRRASIRGHAAAESQSEMRGNSAKCARRVSRARRGGGVPHAAQPTHAQHTDHAHTRVVSIDDGDGRKGEAAVAL